MSDLVGNQLDDEPATARSAERLTGWCGLQAWRIRPIFACHRIHRYRRALGAGIQNLLELTGIQQDLLDPVLGLVGALGGIFTS